MTTDKSKACAYCEKTLQRNRREQKLCSKECQAKYVSRLKRETRKCIRDSCPKNFSAIKTSAQKYCSRRCSAIVNNENRRTRRCKRCEVLLEPNTNSRALNKESTRKYRTK